MFCNWTGIYSKRLEERSGMFAWRAANACVVALLLLISGGAVLDAFSHHGVSILTPWLLGGILAASLAALLSAYIETRRRAGELEASPSGLQSLAEQLE